MAITDINISDTLETNAPSIKYTGNEGPQAPQQMASMEAGQEGTLEDIYQELIGQGFSPREAAEKAKEIYDSMGDMSRAPQQDPGIMQAAQGGRIGYAHGGVGYPPITMGQVPQAPPQMPTPQAPQSPMPAPQPNQMAGMNPMMGRMNPMGGMPRGMPRRMAAGGGIMGSNAGSMLAARTSDGSRPKYGWLDKIKSRVRKLIPNEIAGIAEKAAPFVAPFNPLAAGLMGGIGSFDRTGNLGGAFKSGLMNYGLGQGARYLGGAGFQTGINPMTGSGAQGAGFFSKPTGTETGLGKFFNRSKVSPSDGSTERRSRRTVTDKFIESSGGDKYALGDPTAIEKIDATIKSTTPGKNLSTIGKFIEKNSTAILLGSMGIAAATAKPQDMQEAINATRGTGLDIAGIRKEVQEALAGGEEAWAILQQKYPYVGEFPTKKAEGGRIGLYAGGQSIPSEYTIEDARKSSMQDKMGGITDVMKRADLARQGDVGQMYAAEGGLMDLGGMEKDYRNDGGFVPIGGKEKADDVPARLSKNEFVFTADAVRGAGGGDIDKGAEIMENIMTNLEQGGQMSEDSQGLGGAQEMFDVSERLGEVI